MKSQFFQQKFEETFSEACDRFKDLLRACPHHGFTELHQLDTFYNALNPTDQDSLNAAAGGNLLTKTPRDALTIIENKSKVRNSRNKPVVSKVSANTSSSTTACPSDMAALTDVINAMLRHVKTTSSETVKAISESCVTCGGPHPYYELSPMATLSMLLQPQQLIIRIKDIILKETRIIMLAIKWDRLVFLPWKIIKTVSIKIMVTIKTEEIISIKVTKIIKNHLKMDLQTISRAT
ncbi:hypothetical protein Tco_0808890 [Tanacetum coccineum]